MHRRVIFITVYFSSERHFQAKQHNIRLLLFDLPVKKGILNGCIIFEKKALQKQKKHDRSRAVKFLVFTLHRHRKKPSPVK